MLKLSIKFKLTLFFLVFGLMPLAVVMPIVFGKLDDMQQAKLNDMQTTAAQVNELIDRNLFERYGDVQAFATNSASKDTNNWYKQGSSNPLISSMDAYMTNYGLYKLMMIVDLDGKVAAINSVDNKGNKVSTSSLYNKSFKDAEWFKKAKNKQFLKSESLDGTVVEQPRYESTVSEVYKGEDGFTIPFAAPIYDYNGKMIGVWANFADFGLVEDIVKNVYEQKKNSGLEAIAFAISDAQGLALLNYDPAARAGAVARDSQAIGVKSIADLEIPAAAASLHNAFGTKVEHDSVSGEDDAVSWAKSSGALGYTGLGWVVTMHQPGKYAFADVIAAKQRLKTISGIALLAVSALGLLIGTIISSPIRSATNAAKSLAKGDFKVEIKGTKGSDEIGDLARAVYSIKDAVANYAGQMSAINKVQAVIEFNMDGTIITANDNFCSTLGYSLEEIKGKHHSMFAEPKYVSSHAYKEFWNKLNRGEFDAGEYKRFGKGGREIWINASYNPIFDPDGKPFKVVKYATDITQSKIKNADYSGQIAAISKSQAVIEFNMDGIIQYANENFCSALGYTLEEIKGQHHRIFAEPKYASSNEYKLFWERLRAGEYQAGEFQRFGKGGKEIWINASYNPILDMNGVPFKVVKYASDITQMVTTRTENEKGISEAISVLNSVSAGDLTKQMEYNYTGAFAQIKNALNATIGKLKDTVIKMKQAADSINIASSEISAGGQDLSGRTEQQASNLEETAASMDEITATVRKNTEHSNNANRLATTAKDVAEKGGSVVSDTVRAMDGIEQSSQKIADIINVIDEIAFQTNLLALNAAVEAARAGDAGKGFAVVASEVRALAGRSAAASKDIKNLIVDSVEQVKTGSGLVNEAGSQLKEIVRSVGEVAIIISEIANASAQQSAGIEEINAAVSQMDEMTQQNAALVEENTAAAHSLVEQARSLEALVRFFNIEDGASNSNALQIVQSGNIAKKQPANQGTRKALAQPKRANAVNDEDEGWAEM